MFSNLLLELFILMDLFHYSLNLYYGLPTRLILCTKSQTLEKQLLLLTLRFSGLHGWFSMLSGVKTVCAIQPCSKAKAISIKVASPLMIESDQRLENLKVKICFLNTKDLGLTPTFSQASLEFWCNSLILIYVLGKFLFENSSCRTKDSESKLFIGPFVCSS